MTNPLDKLSNSYIALLLKQSPNPVDTLNSINIENIDDPVTKIICRTIVGSVESLHEHIILNEQSELSNAI